MTKKHPAAKADSPKHPAEKRVAKAPAKPKPASEAAKAAQHDTPGHFAWRKP